MNEFVAKKSGEVHAFIRLVIDTYTQGEEGFKLTLSAIEFQAELQNFQLIQRSIEAICNEVGVSSIALTKSDKTYSKIVKARDDYIAERWDDTVELYEWFSFNAGAGLAHAHEVYGAALILENGPLATAMEQARTYFEELLAVSKNYLYKIGQEKAKG